MSYTQIALKQYVQDTLRDQLVKAFKLSSGGKLRISVFTEFPSRLVNYPTVIIGSVTADSHRHIGEPHLWEETSVSATLISGATYSILDSVEQGGFFSTQVEVLVAGQTTEQRRNALDLVTIFLRDLYRQDLEKEGLALINLSIGRGKTEKIGNNYIYFDQLRVSYFVKGWKKDLSRTQGDFNIVQSIIKQMILTDDGSCNYF